VWVCGEWGEVDMGYSRVVAVRSADRDVVDDVGAGGRQGFVVPHPGFPGSLSHAWM
jgi:hypothetical protein